MVRIIPIKDLKDTTAISNLCKEVQEPIYISKNGYGDMVIMSMKVYEDTMGMLDVYQKLADAEKDVEEGKLIDGRDALNELRKKYNV